MRLDVVVNEGWKSELPGIKVPAPVIAVRQTAKLPVTLSATLVLRPWNGFSLKVEADREFLRMEIP